MSVRQILRKANSFVGVASDSQATLKIDGGPTLDEIILDFQGSVTDFSKILLISLVLNGEEIVRVSGAQLRMLEAYKGLASDNDKLVIPFSDLTANTMEGQQLSGLVTMPQDNIVLNVEFGTVVSPKLKAYFKVSPATSQRHFIPLLKQLTYSPDATGENDFSTLQRGPAIRRMHWLGDIDGMRIVKDGVEHMNVSTPVNRLDLRRQGLTPQVGYVHLDFIRTHWNKSDMFRTDDVVESLIFKPDVQTVAAQTILIESLRILKTPEMRLS